MEQGQWSGWRPFEPGEGQWYRNGVPIPGATSATYRPTREDLEEGVTLSFQPGKAQIP